MIRVMKTKFAVLAMLECACSCSAEAQETKSFKYDALGRLTDVAVSGGPANGVSQAVRFDPAGNRTNVKVEGVQPPAFSVDPVNVTEGGIAYFGVRLTGAVSSTYTVNYSTSNGTATAGSDYTPVSGTLTFLPSQVFQNVAVSTVDNFMQNSNKTFNLVLSSPSAPATLSSASAVGTITDNDAGAIVSIANAAGNVIAPHNSYYSCTNSFNGYWSDTTCRLKSSNRVVAVYAGYIYSSSLAPGYVMSSDWQLQVQSAFYGVP